MRALIFIILFISTIPVFSQNEDLGEGFPGALEDYLFIYHPPSKAMLLLGGTPIIQDSVQSDVWKWDGKTWSRIDASGPGSRIFFKGGLNTKTNEIQLFAGTALGRNNSFMSDLWAFNGKAWSRLLNNDIGDHDHFKMVYANHLDAYVMYGGSSGQKPDTATWLLQGEKFSRLNIPGPGFKSQAAMVYDKHRKKVVLYGGVNNPNEHWEFDGKKWENIITPVNPGIKLYHHMAYDENLKVVVLHGGQINHRPHDPENLKIPFTWAWDGKTWRKIAEERIFAIAIGYHPLRKSILAYGYNDGNENNSRNLCLWELKNYQWTKIADYGQWNTMEYLEKQLKQAPNNVNTLYIYAYKLKGSKRLPEAETIFKKLAQERIPQSASVLRGLIDVLTSQGKLIETLEYILKYEQFGEDRMISTMYYNLACAFALAGQTDQAFLTLAKAIDFGYNTKKDYESDPDLEFLRSDARWKILLEKLR
jgi:hypothetical protein